MQSGVFLLALPFLIIFLVTALYFVSLINITVMTLVVIGCLIYFGLAVGLIAYGKRLMK